VDNGQHLLMGCYRNTMSFLDKIGAAHKVGFQKNMSVSYIEPGKGRFALSCPPLPSPLHLVAGLLRFPTLGLGEKIGILTAGNRLAKQEHDENEKVGEWLVRERQSPASVKYFWEPLVLATLNASTAEASVRLLGQVFRLAFLSGAKNSTMGFARVGLSRLYTEDARSYLEARGGQVLREATVDRLELDAKGRVSGVRLRNGRTLKAAKVISAVPHFALQKLIPISLQKEGEPFGYLPSLWSSPILSIHLWLDREVTGESWAGLIGTDVQWVFNKKRIFAEGEGNYLSLVISHAVDYLKVPAKTILKKALGELEQAFPGAKGAKVLHAVTLMEANATLSAHPAVQKLRPQSKTVLENFFLAGDWIDTGLPATIESAVLSGKMASQALHAMF